MTPLRQRMIEDLILHGLADSTVTTYTDAVAQLARFFNQSPDQLTEDQVRDYLVYLATVKKVARSTHNVALCAIKFFFQHTLEREWTVLDVARPKKEKKLPIVLSRDEVWKILDCIQNPIYRVCLITIYSCGLRLSEGVLLQVPNVDGARKMLHVTGKGAKDRCVPLPDRTLELLREHWCTHKDPLCLFPATRQPNKPSQPDSEAAVRPISRISLQKAFKRALKQSGVHKHAHVHTLRHSYATHLLEAGVQILAIQEYLGHSSLRSTAIYTHLTRVIRDATLDPINGLVERI